ncbi:hypothetical protein [Vibrio sp. 10N]|uniref:hypothetical protein n=1 Tax=Vibrio sp. 10N TaxID=3058938 RepID=UPI002813C2DC|nr:hypothetical protein VB10N_36720 [Vibrio sp. 10N]
MNTNFKPVRFFYRHFNYNSTPSSRKKCEVSLRHSLRISPSMDSVKKLEWNSALSRNNLAIVNGKDLNLSQLTEEERWKILSDIAPEARVRDHTRLKTQHRQYKAKLKKAIDTEYKLGHYEAADFIHSIINNPSIISPFELNRAKAFEMARPKQRLNAIKKYINAHNTFVGKPKSERATYIQEGIFKIPAHWGIGSDIISMQEYMRFTERFLLHHFPQYSNPLIVGHDDERLEEENTGLHTHYFISGQNLTTGEYDLRRSEIKLVNKYLVSCGRESEVLPENGRLNHRQTILLGRYFQEVVQAYTNKWLLNPKGYHAEFSEESEKRTEQYQRMIRQAKLPKSLRDFNYYSRGLEQLKSLTQELRVQEEKRTAKLLELGKQESNAKDELKYTKIEHELLVDRMDDVINNILRFEEQLREKHFELQGKEQEIEKLRHDTEYLARQYLSIEKGLEQRKDELEHVEQQLEKRERELRMMNEDSHRIAVSMIVDAYMLMLAKHKKFDSSARRFTDAIAEKLSSDMPHSFKQIVDVALEQAGFDSQKHRGREFD